MESGGHGTANTPNTISRAAGAAAGGTPSGEQTAAPLGANATADLAGFAEDLFGGPVPAPPGIAKKKRKEQHAKKMGQSSCSSITDRLERAGINDGTVRGNNLSTTIDSPDDVFDSDPRGPYGDSGRESGAVESADFPAEYNIIRTARAAKLAPARLGGLFGLGRSDTGARMGYGEGGLAVEGDGRTHLAQNYHCAGMDLNISFSVKKPSINGDDELMCLACPDPHSHSSRMRDGRPVVIVLADQNFPAVVPARGGDCLLVVRVEDGLLSDLESVFADRFRAFLKPHGSLTPGSVVMVGSISHLRACGLQDYAESLVKTYVSLGARAGAGVDIIPLVHVPMHGLESGSLIRSLMDLDSWLLSVQGGGRTSLPKTRETFWVTITGGGQGARGRHGELYSDDAHRFSQPSQAPPGF